MVPAVLIGLSLGRLRVVGLALAVSAEHRSVAPGLMQELDGYTACLVDLGLDVPSVEIGSDPGHRSTASESTASRSIVGVALGAVAPYPAHGESIRRSVPLGPRNIRGSQIGPDV